MVDDFETEQAATMLVRLHGDRAARYATQWAAALMESGNGRDARKFERIADVIRDLKRERSLARGARARPQRRRRSAR